MSCYLVTVKFQPLKYSPFTNRAAENIWKYLNIFLIVIYIFVLNACISHVCLPCTYHVNIIIYVQSLGRQKRKEEKPNWMQVHSKNNTQTYIMYMKWCVSGRSVAAYLRHHWVVCPRSQIKQTFKKKKTIFTIKAWITLRTGVW